MQRAAEAKAAQQLRENTAVQLKTQITAPKNAQGGYGDKQYSKQLPAVD
jgi:hypothetical protein